MFKNYCRLAWRNLSANRGYTLINIIGLAVGLSAAGDPFEDPADAE